MKALVLFRSHYGNTRLVADSIATRVTALGHEAVVQDLRQKLPDPRNFDFFFVGAPTRFARVTGKAVRTLKQLKKKGIEDRPVAIFDTYGPLPVSPEELEENKKWFYPGAAGIMFQNATKLGLNVYQETLRCDVKAARGPLSEGQIEKIQIFVDQFVSTMRKKP